MKDKAWGETLKQAPSITRRKVLVGAAGIAMAPLFARQARAVPPATQAAIASVVGSAVVREGRVTVELPALAENGNLVALGVRVDSPMTESDHVKTIHVFSEQNPLPEVARFRLGPRAGKADVATRIRVAVTQNIIAVAELSDGSFWSGRANVVVTLGGCIDPT